MDEHELIARIDRSLERIDRHMERGNELISNNTAEFELNREIQNALLARTRAAHEETMRRLEDLGVHMREQTEALLRIQERLGPA